MIFIAGIGSSVGLELESRAVSARTGAARPGSVKTFKLNHYAGIAAFFERLDRLKGTITASQ